RQPDDVPEFGVRCMWYVNARTRRDQIGESVDSTRLLRSGFDGIVLEQVLDGEAVRFTQCGRHSSPMSPLLYAAGRFSKVRFGCFVTLSWACVVPSRSLSLISPGSPFRLYNARGGDTMRRRVLRVFLFSSVAIAGAVNAFAQPPCDRTCLRTLLDQY